MTPPNDRKIHAVTEDGREIVRYDRAGKWYVEGDPSLCPARRLSFNEAVALAKTPGTRVHLGVPGGSRFDQALHNC